MALSKRIDIAHRQFHIAHCFAGKFLPNPFPCNSIGNAQCAMANEIQRYRPNLTPLAFQRRERRKLDPPVAAATIERRVSVIKRTGFMSRVDIDIVLPNQPSLRD
jgi:hypothetical protein